MATADAVNREPERSSWCHSLKVSSVLQENDCETYNPPNYDYAAMVITAALLPPLVFHCSYKNT